MDKSLAKFKSLNKYIKKNSLASPNQLYIYMDYQRIRTVKENKEKTKTNQGC